MYVRIYIYVCVYIYVSTYYICVHTIYVYMYMCAYTHTYKIDFFKYRDMLTLIIWQTATLITLQHEMLSSFTWFLPFSIRMLVTFPKGSPKAMTSVSDTSLGSLRMWRTREGGASSRRCFLLSLPLAKWVMRAAS